MNSCFEIEQIFKRVRECKVSFLYAFARTDRCADIGLLFSSTITKFRNPSRNVVSEDVSLKSKEFLTTKLTTESFTSRFASYHSTLLDPRFLDLFP
jgi:hypothetical protein